ncbi:MAG: trimethylamine methyltransferase family protein, partial [Acidimicrobiia bacterium]
MAGSRSGGRRGRQASNAEPDERSSRYRQLRNPFAPARILSDDQVESIHQSALRVLTEYGIKVLEPESRSIFASFGADVDESTQMVYFESSLVESAMATCPSEFWMRSRGGLRDVHVGGASVAFLPVAGPPHAMDLERGRRTGTLDDYVAFVKLAQTYDVIHALAPSVEPQDVALEERHLQLTLPQLLYSDKIPFIYARGRGGVLDCLEMFQIAWGMD